MDDLFQLLPEELTEKVQALGLPKYRAKQILDWVYQKHVTDFTEMTNLPKPMRAQLAEVLRVAPLPILTALKSKSGDATKFLFSLADGQGIETVLLCQPYGHSVCVSSQVGCGMGCSFCASTLGGVVRNLTAGEMVGQVFTAEKSLAPKERISHIVVMGSGEPLENLDNLLRFMAIVNHPQTFHISYRRITVSTCGIVPGIKRLMGENLPITLAVSLHAPNNALRNRLMPVNRRYPLEELIPACQEYAERTGRRITFEYALMKGINDSEREAGQLVRLLSGMLCHVNLIPVNPVKERAIDKPSPERIKAFAKILASSHIETTVRKEVGADIDAACGQLRRRVLLKKQDNANSGEK